MSQPVFRAPDGTEVQVISIDGLAQYRVRKGGVWQGIFQPDGHRRNPTTIEELGTLVDLAELEAA